MLEVIGFDLKGCEVAQKNGAGRIELCLDPTLGGTTPGIDFIRKARALLTIPLFVMIRPRGGGFTYNEDEFEKMKLSIKFCKEIGADGVVFGILNEHNKINIDKNRELLQLAKGMSCTFHRAFDVVNDPLQAANEIYELGFRRILTSGQKPTALEGADLINELIQKYKDKMTILPGSGVTSKSLPALDKVAKGAEYHTSAKIVDIEGNYIGVDGEEVKAMVNYLKYKKVD